MFPCIINMKKCGGKQKLFKFWRNLDQILDTKNFQRSHFQCNIQDFDFLIDITPKVLILILIRTLILRNLHPKTGYKLHKRWKIQNTTVHGRQKGVQHHRHNEKNTITIKWVGLCK